MNRVYAILTVLLLLSALTSLPGCLKSRNPNDWAFKITQIDKMKMLGFSGKGIKIGVIDTGADPDYINRDRLVEWFDLINGRDEFYDDNGHGTFIISLLISGKSQFGETIDGISPGCEIVAVKAVSEIGFTNDTIISKAIEFCIQKDVDIILLSLYKNPESLDIGEGSIEKCREAIERGIFVVAPAGDDGLIDDGDVVNISSIDGVICAGSINKDLYISSFSSNGNQAFVPGKHEARKNPNLKPEIVAPGEDIFSISKGTVVKRSGTSISSTFIAGALSLVLEAYPELRKSGEDHIERVKYVLAETAGKIGPEELYTGNFFEHNDRYGYGVLQIYNVYLKLGEVT